MTAVKRVGGASAAVIVIVIAMRIVIRVSPGSPGRAYISLMGTLLGFGIGLAVVSIAIAYPRVQIGRAQKRARRASPDGYIVTLVTDEHFESALAALGIERYSRAHYLSLAADSQGIQLIGASIEGVMAAFPWTSIRALTVGVGSTRRSLRNWANLVVSIDHNGRAVDLPLSVLPDRKGGILRPDQIFPVLQAIASRRPA